MRWLPAFRRVSARPHDAFKKLPNLTSPVNGRYFRACLVGGMIALSFGLGFGCLGCLGLRTSRPPLFFDMTHSRGFKIADLARADDPSYAAVLLMPRRSSLTLHPNSRFHP